MSRRYEAYSSSALANIQATSLRCLRGSREILADLVFIVEATYTLVSAALFGRTEVMMGSLQREKVATRFIAELFVPWQTVSRFLPQSRPDSSSGDERPWRQRSLRCREGFFPAPHSTTPSISLTRSSGAGQNIIR
jgi:hypothetical protein